MNSCYNLSMTFFDELRDVVSAEMQRRGIDDIDELIATLKQEAGGHDGDSRTREKV